MNFKVLIQYLESNADSKEVHNYLASEIDSYRKATKKVGSSMPIRISESDKHFIIEAKHLRNLCQDYVDGVFESELVDYIANIIDLSDNIDYADQNIADIVNILANADIHYSINEKLIRAVIDWIDNEQKQKFDSFIDKVMR